MVRGLVAGVVVVGVVLGFAPGVGAQGRLDEVRAVTETASNFDDEAGGDADADDPAIWVHPTRPNDSIVVGTLKNGGLTVFDLRGRELQHVATPPGGRFNNVDILGKLAVVSDRGLDRLRVYAIDPLGARASTVLRDVTVAAPPLVFSADEGEVGEQRTAYGLALWADPAGGTPWVVVSRRHETRLGLFRLTFTSGGVGYRAAGFIDLPHTFEGWTPCAEPGEGPQVEGMVVDRTSGTLYAAQEDVGIWRIPLTRNGFGPARLVEKVRGFGQPATYDEATEECVPTGPPSPAAGRYLTADAEGLTIAYGRYGRTLYASSQGDSTFARYRLGGGGLRYVGGFVVVDSRATDGVQHSDGAAVTTTPLGAAFPHGLLVVHDGENTPAGTRVDTNFKLVRLG
jgi:3-phytase